MKKNIQDVSQGQFKKNIKRNKQNRKKKMESEIRLPLPVIIEYIVPNTKRIQT